MTQNITMHEARFIEETSEHLRVCLPTNPSFRGADWTLRVVSREEEFDQLEERWDELVQHASCTVFQDFAWLRSWWRHEVRAKDAHLHIVVLSCESHIVAIAPLYIEWVRLFGFAPVRCLRFLGRRQSDYLDIIIRHDVNEQDVYAQLVRHLVEYCNQWDVVLLEDIPQRSASSTMLLEAARSVGLEGTAQVNERCPNIILPYCWDEYLRRLSKKERHECRRRERGLQQHFQAEFETITDERELARAFEDFVALHEQAWNDRREPGVFAEKATLAFHREVIGKLFRRGYVRLGFLRLDGKRVAGSYAFVYGTTHALYLLGVSGRHRAGSLGPGIALCCFNIRRAIEEQRRVFDFMRGMERYKYALAAHDEPNWTLTLYAAPRKWFVSARRIRDAVVLWESLRHRLGKELWRLRHAALNDGWLSTETAKQFIRSCFSLIRDGIKKSRAPLQPLYLRTNQSNRTDQQLDRDSETGVSHHDEGSTMPVHSPKPIRTERSRLSQ
ncbi:MAG: hypothetical protein C4326_01335 [Ignavibacteria bacterium]